MAETSKLGALQSYAQECVERHNGQSRSSSVLRGALILLIAVNILAFVVGTVPDMAERYRTSLDILLHVSMVVFAWEYAVRIWTAPLHPGGLYTDPVKGRLRYLVSPIMLADLVVLIPYFVGFGAGFDLRFVRVIRLWWLLGITYYLPAVGTLGRVLKRERRTLFAVMVIMLTMLFIASSLVYLLEHERQPERFASIPHAMWWGMATLTTVGYGDVVPESPLGRVLGVIIMLLGVGTFALPAGILASAFSEERKRRDFMLTWSLVARVPLFESLKAREIADIAILLRPMQLTTHEVVFHKDDEADSMFFIVSGELEVELPHEPCRLGRGAHFGELGLIYRRPRTATVIALSHAELLELDAKDLHKLFERRPKLRSSIMAEAERRLASDRTAAEQV